MSTPEQERKNWKKSSVGFFPIANMLRLLLSERAMNEQEDFFLILSVFNILHSFFLLSFSFWGSFPFSNATADGTHSFMCVRIKDNDIKIEIALRRYLVRREGSRKKYNNNNM